MHPWTKIPTFEKALRRNARVKTAAILVISLKKFLRKPQDVLVRYNLTKILMLDYIFTDLLKGLLQMER